MVIVYNSGDFIEPPSPGSTFFNLETTDVWLANDRTADDFVRNILHNPRIPAFQALGALGTIASVLPAEGSFYVSGFSDVALPPGAIAQFSVVVGTSSTRFTAQSLPATSILACLATSCVFPVTPGPAAPARPLLPADAVP